MDASFKYVRRILPGTSTEFLVPAAGFTPSSLPGIWEWWTSKAGVTESGGAVSDWTGRYAGVTVSQATSAQKPAYSATSFNGGPGLTMESVAAAGAGNSDFLSSATVNFPVTTKISVAVLLNSNNTADTFGGLVSFQAGPSSGFGTDFDWNIAKSFVVEIVNTGPPGVELFCVTTLGNTTWTNGSATLLTYTCTSQSIGGFSNVYKNGSLVSGPNAQFNSGDWGFNGADSRLTFNGRMATENGANGPYALIVIARDEWSASDITNLKNYCNTEFGTAF